MVDLPTLFAVTIFANAMSGVLLIYAWFTNRHTPALALWAIGYLVATTGMTLIVARGTIGDFWSIDIANALVIAAYGIVWMGARSFNNRKTPVLYVLVGPATWLVVCQFEALHSSISARIVVVSFLLFCYTLLTGFEFWRGDRKLSSCWPLIVVIGIHAVVFLSRILWPGWVVERLTGRYITLSVFAFVSFELLFHTFCAAFLLAFLVKERREGGYKRASLVDPLTGVWNRRAFLDYASRQLSRAASDNLPVALIAFDLDQFKTINDSYGHLAGDRLLCSFCDVVSEALRSGDVFGRIGGEEFACLLADVSGVDAAAVAERLRCRFANTEINCGSSRLRATVSSGVALAGRPHPDLEALMSAADRALYRAKELGRNRVELSKTIFVARNARDVANPRAVP
jgi:diguanylate cyclase (GGDEF)-like protein